MLVTLDAGRNAEVWAELLEGLTRADELIVATWGAPRLYRSGVRYSPEDREVWRLADEALRLRYEDCESLAAWLAAEVRVYGAAALTPSTRAELPGRIDDAFILLEHQGGNVWHCTVGLQVGSRVLREDPSARLGMFGYLDPEVS